MDTGNDDHRIEAAEQQARQPAGMADKRAEDKRNAVAERATGRADQQQGDKAGDNHRQERSEDQVQRVRDHAAQPLLDHAHKPHRQQHREDGALVADHRHFDAEEIHGVEAGGDAPGVGQRRMGEDPAEGRAQIGVTAKFACGGKADQDRQNDKRRRTAHIQHDIESVARVDPTVGFHHPQQAHQQAGGDDGGNNRHEDVGQQAGNALERVQLFRRQVGGFGFARFADARRLDKGSIDFIDHPGAEDDLHLSGIAKAAFHPVDFANRLLIGERVVDQHQPQAGGAVRGAGDIFLAAQQGKQ